MPNDLGLFDTLGNMFEWCQEQYDGTGQADTYETEHINERPRLLRGGSFSYPTGERPLGVPQQVRAVDP